MSLRELRARVARPSRRAELTKLAREYAGQLVYNIPDTYTAFEDLPSEEQEYIDEYLRELGSRLTDGGRG